MKFSEAIKKAKEEHGIAIIPDLKFYSPIYGDLLKNRKPLDLANQIVNCGVTAMSMVTAKEFKGNKKAFRSIAKNLKEYSLPLLRKDFLFDKKDILESYKLGASAVLLITPLISTEKLETLNKYAHSLSLETVAEIHTPKQLETVLGMKEKPDVLGINNRDIKQLEKDKGNIAITENLLKKYKPKLKDFVIMSESGITTENDIKRIARAGADAVLIGTSLMQASNITEKLKEFMQAVEKR